jgi:hypothetical protein
MRWILGVTALALLTVPAAAQNDLPEGVEQLMTCGHVYSLRSTDAKDAGDEGVATEFFNMGDALLWQARTTLEGAGYTAEQIQDIEMNSALINGFSYGADGESMLATCLAAWDSP